MTTEDGPMTPCTWQDNIRHFGLGAAILAFVALSLLVYYIHPPG